MILYELDMSHNLRPEKKFCVVDSINDRWVNFYLYIFWLPSGFIF